MRAMVVILKRLKEFGDKAYGRQLRGRGLASTFSESAVRWGNVRAPSWRNGRNHILFLDKILDIVRLYK